MAEKKNALGIVHRLEIIGALTRQDLEALELEIRRLAKDGGIEIAEFRIEQIDEEDP
jgi:hypothetical protein